MNVWMQWLAEIGPWLWITLIIMSLQNAANSGNSCICTHAAVIWTALSDKIVSSNGNSGRLIRAIECVTVRVECNTVWRVI